MGAKTQILLVVLLSSAAGLIGWLTYNSPEHTGRVRAEEHSAFWIWGGVHPQPAIAQAKSLYILQGEVVAEHGRTRLTTQGMAVARLRKGEIWLVYRTNTLNWPPEILPQLVSRLKLWQLSGNPIAGLQLDFDARTKRLGQYVSFLRQVRQKLPAEYRFSITGLLDWSSNGDIDTINQLKTIVDEVAIQTYQGRATVQNCTLYLRKLSRLTLPFKIGLMQHGAWQPDKELESGRWFRGYIVFLQNRR